MGEPSKEQIEASDFLRKEFHDVINRYSEMTVYQVIGVLETVKMDIWDKLEKIHQTKD